MGCGTFLYSFLVLTNRAIFIKIVCCGVARRKVQGGADKSLAWPGRKQATVTKLGIYSAYSPRSSIHFLGCCSNFCKPLKKIQKVVHPTRSPRQQWPPCQTKNGDLLIIFSVQGPGGSLTGPDPENHTKSTRQFNDFYQPITNFTVYQRGVHYMGIRIFNNLPPYIKIHPIMSGNLKFT